MQVRKIQILQFEIKKVENSSFNLKFLILSLRPVSTSANLAARIGTVACSSIEKKQSDWFSFILVAKKLNLIQLPELTARSPVNAGFQLGFRAAHALIAHRLVARPNSPKWKPAFILKLSIDNETVFVLLT